MDAVIAGHPIHPSLIPIPIGVLPASYVLDILAMMTDSDALADAAYYNMLIGCAGAVPAAITGYMDYQKMGEKDPAHETAMTHGLANAGIMILYGINLWVRRNNRRSRLGFILSTIGTLALGFSGYLGGEIAYGRGWRVRSTERFELNWQKANQKGAFAPNGQTDESYPPEVTKAFEEKKSGDELLKEIKQNQTDNSFTKPQTPTASNGNHPLSRADFHNNRETPRFVDDKPSQAEGDRETIEEDLSDQAQG